MIRKKKHFFVKKLIIASLSKQNILFIRTNSHKKPLECLKKERTSFIKKLQELKRWEVGREGYIDDRLFLFVFTDNSQLKSFLSFGYA